MRATALRALAAAQTEFKNTARKREQDLAKEENLPAETYAAEKQYFAEARALFDSQGSRFGVADVDLIRLALDIDGFGTEKRRDEFLRVARECADLGESICEALSLTNVAAMLRDLGDYAGALDASHVALRLVGEREDPATFAIVSDNLAFLLRMSGDYDAAIHHHRKALAGFATFGECSGVTQTYYGLGYELLGVGDPQQALRFYKLALERTCTAAGLESSTRGPNADANSVRALCEQTVQAIDLDTEDRETAAWIAWDLGNLARAQSDGETALICHDIGTRLVTTRNRLLGIGLDRVRDLLALGRIQEARQQYSSLQPKVANAHDYYKAHARDVEALLLVQGGKDTEAIEKLRLAADLYRDQAQFDGASAALALRAALAANAGDRRANELFEDADEALEHVRLLSLDPAYSASLFASGRRIYNDWIASLESRPDSEESGFEMLAVSERSRSRLLAQISNELRRGQEAHNSQARSVSSNTLALLERLEAGNEQTVDADSPEDTSSEVVRRLAIESERFDIKARSKGVARLRQYQRSLAADVVAVEYLLGEERSHAWVLKRDSLEQFELAPAARIREAVKLAREAVEAGTSLDVSRDALAALHELLVAPLTLTTGEGALVIVPDDALFDIPFSALWDSGRKQYLVEQMAITYLPSFQLAGILQQRPPKNPDSAGALLVGDPVYQTTDAQVRCSPDAREPDEGEFQGMRLRRIPATAREVEAVSALMASTDNQVQTLTGCAANRSRVTASNLERFRYIHFATHAAADAIAPQRSAIYLSAFDERGAATRSALTGSDLLDHALNADLVVLSGCSTAGGRRFAGEGTLGLSFSIIASGGRSVISTLWPVADAPSVDAMSRLYSGLLRGQLTAAQSLRAAQIELIRSKRWSHPRNWAAYSLLGAGR